MGSRSEAGNAAVEAAADQEKQQQQMQKKQGIRAMYDSLLQSVYRLWCFVYSIKEQVQPRLEFQSWKRWFHYVVLITIWPQLKQIFLKLFPRRIEVPASSSSSSSSSSSTVADRRQGELQPDQ
jgi:hypothetical protein